MAAAASSVLAFKFSGFNQEALARETTTYSSDAFFRNAQGSTSTALARRATPDRGVVAMAGTVKNGTLLEDSKLSQFCSREFKSRATLKKRKISKVCNSFLELLDSISYCCSCSDARQLHGRLITSGALHDPSFAAEIVRRLSSSRCPPLVDLARCIFFSLPSPNPFLWNSLIKSFSHGDEPEKAVVTFVAMLFDGVCADKFSLSLVLKACCRMRAYREGLQIHSMIHKFGLSNDVYLQNCLIVFYCRCGLCRVAHQVFDRICERDVVSWNSMMDGYVKNGLLGHAKELFDEMDDGVKNLVTWNTVLDGYISSDDGIDVGRLIFDRMPMKDTVSWNLMIEGYAKCGRLADAKDLFEKMPNKDVISWTNMIDGYMEFGRVESARGLFDEMLDKDVITWNIMMAGYLKNNFVVEALDLFKELQMSDNISPDVTTLAMALSAISEMGRLHDGQFVHKYILRNHLSLNGKLGVALIDMYSKCGQLQDAIKIFDCSGKTVDHWNAMIGGLAIHGYGELAFKLFLEMDNCLIKPDDITFIGVLNACSHAGLLKEGLISFELMRKNYGLEPKVQHYGCLVDILGRAGQLDEAWRLVHNMPIIPNDVVWKSLLSACSSYGNFDMGQKVVKNLTELDAHNSSSYVLLSNLYARIGMWSDVSKVRMVMRNKDLKKEPGCSWIELEGVLHEFVV